MPTVTSHFESEAFKTFGQQPLTRPVTYASSSFTSRAIDLDSIKLNAEDFIIPDYSVSLDNLDQQITPLVTERWTGQDMVVDFGFWDGSSAQTVRVFTGYGRELSFDGERIDINCEGKFAYLANKKVGSTGSYYYFSNSYNPANLFFYALTTFTDIDDTESSANTDINWTSYQSWQAGMTTIGFQVQYKIEGDSMMDFIREFGRVTQTYIFEDEGKLNFQFYTPGVPGTYTVNTLGPPIYQSHPTIEMVKVTNEVHVFHGFDVTSDVWAGEAVEVKSTSVGSYGIQQEFFDSEMVWHTTSASASQFANRVLIARNNGAVRARVTGELPLWTYTLGDRLFLNIGSYGVTGEFAVIETTRNPITRECELQLESTEPWISVFILDYDVGSGGYGLLDQSDNPIY